MRVFDNTAELALTKDDLQGILKKGLERHFKPMTNRDCFDVQKVSLYPDRKYCIRITLAGRKEPVDDA